VLNYDFYRLTYPITPLLRFMLLLSRELHMAANMKRAKKSLVYTKLVHKMLLVMFLEVNGRTQHWNKASI
jgi:hypothetical protein